MNHQEEEQPYKLEVPPELEEHLSGWGRTSCAKCHSSFTVMVPHLRTRRTATHVVSPWGYGLTLCVECDTEEAAQKRLEGLRAGWANALEVERETLLEKIWGGPQQYPYPGTKSLVEHGRPGPRYESFTLEDSDLGEHNRKAYETAAAWLEKPEGNLIVVGPVGAGKTHLASCIWRALLTRLDLTLWVGEAHYLQTLKAGWGGNSDAAERAAEIREKAKAIDFLIIDDLGKTHSRAADWIESELYLIVDSRYSAGLPTVVTSQFPSKALTGRIGESVVTRLVDGARIVSLKAHVYRKAQP